MIEKPRRLIHKELTDNTAILYAIAIVLPSAWFLGGILAAAQTRNIPVWTDAESRLQRRILLIFWWVTILLATSSRN
jgi:hypothetical protein